MGDTLSSGCKLGRRDEGGWSHVRVGTKGRVIEELYINLSSILYIHSSIIFISFFLLCIFIIIL